MKVFARFASLLALCGTALAATYSLANLNGSYAVQFSQPRYAQWSKTFSCPTNSSITYTAVGSTTTTTFTHGVVSFDGNGNATATVTNASDFDSAASANTLKVTWNSACQIVSVNPGGIVYKAPSTQSVSGKYTIQSTGLGTVSFGAAGTLNLQLTATASNGISTTALLSSPVVNGKSVGTGIAVRQ